MSAIRIISKLVCDHPQVQYIWEYGTLSMKEGSLMKCHIGMVLAAGNVWRSKGSENQEENIKEANDYLESMVFDTYPPPTN